LPDEHLTANPFHSTVQDLADVVLMTAEVKTIISFFFSSLLMACGGVRGQWELESPLALPK
jgi:hypothetical protein